MTRTTLPGRSRSRKTEGAERFPPVVVSNPHCQRGRKPVGATDARAAPLDAQLLADAEAGADVERLPAILRPGTYGVQPDGSLSAPIVCPVCGNAALTLRSLRANVGGYEFGTNTGVQCSDDRLAQDRLTYIEAVLTCPRSHEVVVAVEGVALPAGVRVIATAEVG